MEKQPTESLTILNAPFSPSYTKYCRLIHLDAYPDAEDEAKKLFEAAVERLKPVSVLFPLYIDSREQQGSETVIHAAGCTFRGKVLSQLDSVYRVFPYIATCGAEMESFDFAEELESDDMLAPFWLDTLKTMALGAARLLTVSHLKRTYGLNTVSSVNPGSGNVDIWPIDQLSCIFSLLQEGKPVGVRLTESSLMIPNKTISGLFYESDTQFTSCRYCERPNCPGRKEPFGGTRL